MHDYNEEHDADTTIRTTHPCEKATAHPHQLIHSGQRIQRYLTSPMHISREPDAFGHGSTDMHDYREERDADTAGKSLSEQQLHT
mmetsp:Transcript_43958/g.106792  ORF Transcript_43958/g.106792 Transcript_43958/m.106792 type:complete len:85 (-) Transcript_43958:18-272(-)